MGSLLQDLEFVSHYLPAAIELNVIFSLLFAQQFPPLKGVV